MSKLISLFNRTSQSLRLSLQKANYCNASITLQNNIRLSVPYCKTNTSLLDNPIHFTNKRNIFTEQTLGIDKLNSLQESRVKFYENGKDRYIERIANYVEQGNFESILREDLINMIGLAENERHLDLIEAIAKNSKNNYEDNKNSWGSAVMRLYYKMNLIDRALNNIKNLKEFGLFFNQRVTYQTALTMLYNAGRYTDVLEVYEYSIKNIKQNEESVSRDKFTTDRRLAIVALAACAKLNTLEHLKKAQEIYAKDTVNPILKGRTISFISYMALNLDKPVEALNILADAPNKSYIVYRELKTIALLKLDRFDDVLYHLRETINLTKREHKMILHESYNAISETLSKMDDTDEITKQLRELLVELKDNDQIGKETIDSFIFKEIDITPRVDLSPRDGRFEPSRIDSRFERRRYAGQPNTEFNNRRRYGGEAIMDSDGQEGFGRQQSNRTFRNRPIKQYDL